MNYYCSIAFGYIFVPSGIKINSVQIIIVCLLIFSWYNEERRMTEKVMIWMNILKRFNSRCS